MYAGDALVTALYAALNGNITGTLHDGMAPAGTAYPHTEMGAPTSVPDDDRDKDGADMTVTFHVWSPSKATVDAITSEIDALLHRQTLTVTGAGCWQVRQDNIGPAIQDRDPDTGGVLWHGVPRYRFRLAEA